MSHLLLEDLVFHEYPEANGEALYWLLTCPGKNSLDK